MHDIPGGDGHGAIVSGHYLQMSMLINIDRAAAQSVPPWLRDLHFGADRDAQVSEFRHHRRSGAVPYPFPELQNRDGAFDQEMIQIKEQRTIPD